jgi:hypothetical protein
MIERGLQPDLLSGLPEAHAGSFLERGATFLPPTDEPDPDTSLIEWTVTLDPAKAMPRIARIVSEAIDPTRTDTPARRQWLDRSPRYLGRAFGHYQCLRVTNAECGAIVPLLHSENPSATITRDGEGI